MIPINKGILARRWAAVAALGIVSVTAVKLYAPRPRDKRHGAYSLPGGHRRPGRNGHRTAAQMTSQRVSSRRTHSVNVRRRAYVAQVNSHDSNTSNTRDTLVTPSKGRRIRLLRVRVIQELAAGRHLWELYFGTGADITINPDNAIDILDIPDLGEASTRTFLREEGPRGLRDEVLSGRWLGTPPTTVHKVIVEYSDES